MVHSRPPRRSRHQGRRAAAVLAVAQRHAGQPERDLRVQPRTTAHSIRPTRGPIPTGSASACRAPAAASTSRSRSVRSSRTSGRWATTLTLTAGLRYDVEKVPFSGESTIRCSKAPTTIRSTPTTFSRRLGLAYNLGGATRPARRLRPLLRQDPLRSHRRRADQHPVRDVVQSQLPAEQRGSESAAGAVADRSVPRQRSGDHRRDARRARAHVPERRERPQHRRDVRQPGPRACRTPTSCRSGSSGSSRRYLSVSADYVHAFGRDMLMAVALNPTLRATTVDDVAERPAGQRHGCRPSPPGSRRPTRDSRRSPVR